MSKQWPLVGLLPWQITWLMFATRRDVLAQLLLLHPVVGWTVSSLCNVFSIEKGGYWKHCGFDLCCRCQGPTVVFDGPGLTSWLLTPFWRQRRGCLFVLFWNRFFSMYTIACPRLRLVLSLSHGLRLGVNVYCEIRRGVLETLRSFGLSLTVFSRGCGCCQGTTAFRWHGPYAAEPSCLCEGSLWDAWPCVH